MSALARLALSDAETVVNLATGERVTLALADTEELAQAREALVVLDAERKAAIAALDAEIVSRTDAGIKAGVLDGHTYVVGDYRVEVDAPTKRTTHTSELRRDLIGRAERGEIDLAPEAIDNAFVGRTTYYRHVARWNNLARQVPEIDRLLADYSEPVRRYAKVTRFRPVAVEASADELDPPSPGVSDLAGPGGAAAPPTQAVGEGGS